MAAKAKYLLGEGWKNLKANRQMTIASVGVLMACMLIIGGALLLSVNINSIMGYVESMNEAKVWVLEGESDTAIEVLGQELADMDNISGVTFVSKEAALAQEREKLGDMAAILDGFEDDNPYPDSFIIQVDDLGHLDDTVAAIEKLAAVDYVSSQSELANTLTDIKTGINFAGLMIVVILAAVSVIIVGNTIKVTVYSRRREINIMKYVGATDAFIRVPFLVEGVTIGLVSALLSFGLLWLGYGYVLDWVSGTSSAWLAMAFQYLVEFRVVAPAIFCGFLGGGLLFGLFGSMFFLGRYLKV